MRNPVTKCMKIPSDPVMRKGIRCGTISPTIIYFQNGAMTSEQGMKWGKNMRDMVPSPTRDALGHQWDVDRTRAKSHTTRMISQQIIAVARKRNSV